MADGPNLELIAISVGNTRTRIGHFRGESLERSTALPNDDVAKNAGAILGLGVKDPRTPVVIASVNRPAADRLEGEIEGPVRRRGGELYRFGRDLRIPIATALTDESTVGEDRLLNALGAYSRARQACIVVDAGTAVTVDFVDGEGTFQGGAIAPGLNLMLRALHEHTAALPALRFEAPTSDAPSTPPPPPFGKDTREAMLTGVLGAARGLTRHLIERYAEYYDAYPQIIATGGDARTLFERDDLIEHIVPDLALIGIQAACAAVLDADGQ
jgi:type III pantothenate kinase